MKFICAQPAIDYYTWQIEVMIKNFIKNGVRPEDMHILCAYRGNISEKWLNIQKNNQPVNFFFYPDTRDNQIYIPSIYFNMMKQHIKAYPELEKEVLFLHDCDIIFTKPIDFSPMVYDKIWYLSDTIGYIGTQYVLEKGEEQYKEMCKIVGIDPLIPRLMNSNSGGAQHIVKNTNYEYWNKVEEDSIKLYKYLSDREPEWKGKGHPIQKWTAGMWSLLWNAWLFGHETKVDKRLDFCWATDPIIKWEKCSIFHNAGVTVDRKDLFFKGGYITKLPYDIKQEDFSDKYCSWNYIKEILEKKFTSCLI